MPHARTSIRESLKTLLEAQTTTPIEMNRAHASSAFPIINIKSGAEESGIDDNAFAGVRTHRYTLIIEYQTDAANFDVETDDFIEILDDVLELNPSNAYWSACFRDIIEEPEDVPGETTYSKTRIHIEFMYED